MPKLKEVDLMENAMPKCTDLVALCNDAVRFNFVTAFETLKRVVCRRDSPIKGSLSALVAGLRVKEICHFLLETVCPFSWGRLSWSRAYMSSPMCLFWWGLCRETKDWLSRFGSVAFLPCCASTSTVFPD